MTKVRVSEQGRITIPADVRRKLGIQPGDELALEAREDEAVLRPLRSVDELFGIFHEYAQGRDAEWDTVRREAQEAVAKQVADE